MVVCIPFYPFLKDCVSPFRLFNQPIIRIQFLKLNSCRGYCLSHLDRQVNREDFLLT